MRPIQETQVLVVGAGPVGLYTAIRLADVGLQIEIIDQGDRPAAQSYACALHPDALDLLAGAGIADAVHRAGRPIESIAFHDQAACRARIELAALSTAQRSLLVIPQGTLEAILEKHLLTKHGVHVKWNHRLAHLETKPEGVLATIEEMEMSAKGYIVPDFDWIVRRTLQRNVEFVVGADGRHSQVRRCLDIAAEPLGPAETFSFIEFTTDSPPATDVQVVIADGTVNVCWPISPHRVRWTVETGEAGVGYEPVGKERSRIQIEDAAGDAACRAQLLDLLERRAPWSTTGVGEILWHSTATFTPTVSAQMSLGHCLLAGDAAHEGGLVGVHSMNDGLRQGEEIAQTLAGLRGGEPASLRFDTYSNRNRNAWCDLHGPRRNEALQPKSECDHWVKQHRRRITDAIPATSLEQMDRLLGQIGLRILAT